VQTASPRADRDTIESTVIVQRPVEDVFRFYRDLRNLPEVLGDVMAVEQIDPATYRWTIEGPLGTQVHWTITVTEERPNELIRYQAGWHTSWELHFSPGPEAGSTVVHEIVRSALGPIGRAALELVGKSPQAGRSPGNFVPRPRPTSARAAASRAPSASAAPSHRSSGAGSRDP
jgi:uncharacterized membrane protein